MKLRDSLALTLVSIAVTSCVDPYSQSPRRELDRSPKAIPTQIGFAEVRSKVFEPHCVRCHERYATFEAVSREIDPIKRAVDSNRMPKSASPLDIETKALLEAWVSAGAPETLNGPPPSKPSELEPTWASLATLVFAPKCISCHSSDGQARFLDLTSRQSFFTARNKMIGASKLIDFDSPADSGLLVVLNDDEAPMPPTESGFTRLDAKEKEAITSWIANGLP